MKFRLSMLLSFWFAAVGAGAAAEVSLTPRESVTLRFESVQLLEKGTPSVPVSGIAAQVTMTLDATGTVLTITLQNGSLAVANTALYAFDLGLSPKLVNQARFEGTFSEVPRDGAWLGPTDTPGPTAGTGNCTFAVREAVLGRMEDLLAATNKLPPGVLQAGERANISLKIIIRTAQKDGVLRLDPRAYFRARSESAQS